MAHQGAAITTGGKIGGDAQRQAAAIGATIDPNNGWWFKDGRHLSREEADALTNKAGVAVRTADESRGWLADTINHNEGWLRPATEAVSNFFLPGSGAAIDAGWSYAKDHDLKNALISGGTTYALGKLQSAGQAKLPGIPGMPSFAQSAGSAAATSGGGAMASGGGILDTIGGIFKKPDGSWDWGKVGSTAAGAISAFDRHQQTQNQAKNNQQMIDLQRDRMALDDAQFAAKYAMDKATADERIREFERTTGDSEGLQAVSLQHQLDTAPLRDRAQAMLQSRLGAPPQAFHPRDYTQGFDQLHGTATGGSASTLAAGQHAAANYQPGQGGVNTEAMQALIQRFLHPAAAPQSGAGTYTAGAVGKGYTPPAPAAPAAPMAPSAPTAPTTASVNPAGAYAGAPGGAAPTAPGMTPGTAIGNDDQLAIWKKRIMGGYA